MVELVLAATDEQRLPRWAPGGHVDLVLPTGLTRPYSLAGDPDDDRSWRLLVARSPTAGDGAGNYIHDVLRTGERLRVRGPRHLFSLGGGARYLFLAAGAGIAPLLPMVRRVRAARVYPWSLVHVDGSSRYTALREEVESLGATSRSSPARRAAVRALADAHPDTAVYACGSSRFVDELARAAPRGVDLHRQRFDAPGGGPGAGRAYEVVLARQGERIRVEPGTRLLSALHQAGVEVPVSCGTGNCGACLVRVLGGAIEHHDRVLTDLERKEGRQIVSCVSTAAGPQLVLDL
ncbi:flavin reductase family protein [Frankia sp. AgB32]|uniref:flavin reductase family protein n=1 Tax=Frankia sp. AgB32 TaxID=631119 RepID=UPI00200CDEE7|nr:iron-sulfur cluster-binding domain-containing protein [Frankia sp. AgB32]MCK9896021.1 iron-sulfur cluster-binding domain-containing protein [Frankia sp. AgB32]